MRKPLSILHLLFNILVPVFISSTAHAVAPPETKEWTFLIFLNGNNNLDSFGKMNVNQMEKVGSTADINIVVQWASLANKKTQRLYVTKDNEPSKVTSPILQDMGNVDMGDWKSLVEFVRWGVAQFPARHYFIDIWDHGSGWHAIRSANSYYSNGFTPFDISWDDHTGHSISTVQLGQALAESAKIIGHKVDLYASDACLMAMAEVADEVSNSVEIFAGSEEVEPGEGWPYEDFLNRWTAQPLATAAEVSTLLTDTYIRSYSGGSNGTNDGTFSAFDLNQTERLREAIADFGKQLSKLNETSRKKVVSLIGKTQNFTISDYADLLDFVRLVEEAKIQGIEVKHFDTLRSAAHDYIIAHDATSAYARAHGLSIWLPSNTRSLNSYWERYQKLQFQQLTHWGDTLRALLK
jgi:hypothetical protein